MFVWSFLEDYSGCGQLIWSDPSRARGLGSYSGRPALRPTSHFSLSPSCLHFSLKQNRSEDRLRTGRLRVSAG